MQCPSVVNYTVINKYNLRIDRLLMRRTCTVKRQFGLRIIQTFNLVLCEALIGGMTSDVVFV